jgi:hypothetical protein
MFPELIFDVSEIGEEIRQGFAQLGKDVAQALEPALAEGANVAKTSARFKDRSGDARRKTEGVVLSMSTGQDGAKGELRCEVPYASFLNDGTAPHEIRPRLGKGSIGPLRAGQKRGSRKARAVLAWTDGGGQHFAPVVHHPGTKADGFMDRGAEAAERVLNERIDAGITRLGQRLSR